MAWQARHTGTLPVLSCPQLTFETAAKLANVEGYISAKTPLKVERAQVCNSLLLNHHLLVCGVLEVRFKY